MTIRDIIIENLTRTHAVVVKSRYNNDTHRIGSTDLFTANILCGTLGINNIDLILKFGKFISESWTDLEITENQINNIEKELMNIRKINSRLSDLEMGFISKEEFSRNERKEKLKKIDESS